jgi:hypothetical protein
MSCAGPLFADENVRAAVHHPARAAAVLIEIIQAVRFPVIDEHRLAAIDRHPGVWTATKGVDARIVHPQGGLVVNDDIGRTGNRRADAFVGTTLAAVGVHGDQRAIAKPGKRFQRQSVYTESGLKERGNQRRSERGCRNELNCATVTS